MLAADIRDYLIAQGLGSTSNIFAGPINENVSTGIGIFEKYGRAPDKISELEFPDFDVMARGATKYAAYVLAHNAYVELHQLTDVPINTTLYKRIEATGSPNYFGKDNLDRFIYIGGFTTIRVIDSPITALFICGPYYCGLWVLKSKVAIP